MIYLFVAYLVALLLALFVASWRVALWATALESFFSGLVLLRWEGLETWPARIQFLDLVVIRFLLVPLLLYGVFRRVQSRREYNTVPANFVVWVLALVLLIASFWFGAKLSPANLPSAFEDAVGLGVAVAGILTGFFILSNQSTFVGQIIGLLTLESGVALNELLSGHHSMWVLQIGLSAAFAWMLGVLLEFARQFSRLQIQEDREAPPAGTEEEMDVL